MKKKNEENLFSWLLEKDIDHHREYSRFTEMTDSCK